MRNKTNTYLMWIKYKQTKKSDVITFFYNLNQSFIKIELDLLSNLFLNDWLCTKFSNNSTFKYIKFTFSKNIYII